MAEIRRFLAAVQFLTRLPTPRRDAIEAGWLFRSAKYFPLVGIVVGAVAAGVLLIAGRVWTGALPALLAVAAAVLITGALHEDGLADTADGLGGGRSREACLSIMKDSRIGVYGALALGLSLSVRVAALASMPLVAAATALVAAHAGGRLAAVILMSTVPYAGDPARRAIGDTAGALRTSEFAFAVAFGLAPLLLMGWGPSVGAVALGGAGAIWLALAAHRRVGGHTGDVIGAVEQIFETGFLLGASAMIALAAGR